MTDATDRIRINGKDRELPRGLDLRSLLEELGIQPGPGVAVERNREIVTRDDYASTLLEDGDELEIVTLVGG